MYALCSKFGARPSWYVENPLEYQFDLYILQEGLEQEAHEQKTAAAKAKLGR